jgi:hypothetical protein
MRLFQTAERKACGRSISLKPRFKADLRSTKGILQ